MSKYKTIIEKEYYSLSLDEKEPIIGCLMMVKNEEKRIHVSLESVTKTVKCFIIYDTGSTDKTKEIIINYCEKNKINLYMIEGEFVNFSVSRNVLLDYADTKNVHFLLLLDTNDELRGGDILVKIAKSEMKSNNCAYYICQQWWSGKYDKYFNIRFIKPRNNWRFKGAVHEYISDISENIEKKNISEPFKLTDDIFLYQDRTLDDDKTSKRFYKDKMLLLADYKKDPKDPRTLFYLAQTCACLLQKEEAFYYYKLRTEVDGFYEEKFHSFLRCGELSEELEYNWYNSLAFYMKAIEHSERAEPLIKISNYYMKKEKWLLSYTFIKMACSIPYPEKSILFVDKGVYDYKRWHIMGIVAYYCGYYLEGKIACLKAIKAGINPTLDKNNLEFYEKKL